MGDKPIFLHYSDGKKKETFVSYGGSSGHRLEHYVSRYLYYSSLDSSEDRDWMNSVMDYHGFSFPLEDTYGFTLVERERDFTLGQLEMENITAAIEQSRRMLIVLSR